MSSRTPIRLCGLLVFPALIFMALSAHSAAPSGDTFTVRIKGVAEGVGLAARKKAVEQAEQEAVTEALQSMTGSTDLTAYKPVLSQASRYILRSDILRSEVVGQTTEVEVDSVIQETSLRYDVATIMLPRLPRKPSVRFLIADFIGPEAHSGGPTLEIAEAVFQKHLREFGLEVKGVHDLLDQYEASHLVSVAEGDMESAASFARSCLEDVVIVGTARTTHEPLTPDSNMLRNRADVSLRVFSGPDGKMHDTLCAQAVVQSVDPVEGGIQATQDSCGKLAGECIVAVILAMAGLNDSERVLIMVEQPGDPDTVESLRTALSTVVGVENVKVLFFSTSEARLEAQFSGSMAFFSDSLAHIPLKEKRVEVVRCVAREVALRLH